MAAPGFFSFRPTRFQFGVITVLVATALSWTLLLTGFREYWGFWQSPEIYHFLKKEYPIWFRAYIHDYYELINLCTSGLFLIWAALVSLRLRAVRSVARFYGLLLVLVIFTAMQGAILGVRCKNNFATFLDRGDFEGKIERFEQD